MHWMVLIMGLPVWGLVLFLLLPWRVALIPYLMIVGMSVLFDVLMTRSMKLRPTTGREGMVGSTAVVLDWEGGAGHVTLKGEIWQAKHESPLTRGDTVVVEDMRGLTLVVKPAGSAERG
jgi:membrane-bound serine protease (ClpP class)